MKIALCFLTRANLQQPQLWNRFFKQADRSKYTLYCHPKEPERVTDRILADRIIGNLVPTEYAHVSLVVATLSLFVTAFADPANEYFVLVSESTIPIIPFATLYRNLSAIGARSVANFKVPPANTEHHRRLFSLQQPQRFQNSFFQHDQWVILHRRHVALLYDFPLIEEFQRMYASDEHYFMNVLVHLKGAPVNEFVNQRTTFVNWNDQEIRTYKDEKTNEVRWRTVHPKTYGHLFKHDIDRAQSSGGWFFRKVDASCDCSLVEPYVGA
jgi:hypothetical protein